MRYLLILFLIGISLNVLAQQTHWATQVLEYSTQRAIPNQTTEYKATQVLGKPNKLPNYGDSYCAWSPSTPDNPFEEYIKVSFDTLMPIQQIAVAENLGQGCVVKIVAYDNKGHDFNLYEDYNPIPIGIGKMLTVTLDKPTSFPVYAIKIFLNTIKVRGWNQIDAIGISQSIEPIHAYIRLAQDAPKADKVIRENLGRGVNSRHGELAPVIAHDGKTLYYTRAMVDRFGGIKAGLGIKPNEDQDIFVSTMLKNGRWGKAKNMGSPINNKDKNAIFSVSADGREVLLMNKYLSDGRMEAGISRSTKTRNGWSFPQEIKIQNYINQSSEANFTISSDGKILLMSIQGRDTQGKRDLYVSFLQKDNTWSEPLHTGSVLNTAENEATPFIAADGKTLYFSTMGFPGFGDNDIFRSKRLDDSWTKWSEPENLGPAINTPAWDGFFTIPASGEYAYVCSVRDSFRKDDIFRLKLPESIQPDPVAMISGQVLDISNNKPLLAEVLVKDNFTKKAINQLRYNPLEGNYTVVLPLQKDYIFTPYREGYLPISNQLDFSKEKNYKEVKQTLYLLAIEKGATMVLQTVQFEQGKFELLPSAFEELDRIAKAMTDSQTMEIMLDGHTDNQGDFNLNIKLSEDRVLEIKKYLVAKEIAEDRIQTKGWGGSKPIDSNFTEDRRQKNRRVEITILKK